MKILHVVGARPNFMKLAPVFRALKRFKIHQKVVHTGQHYSKNMSDVFFFELGLKKPDVNLRIGSASHTTQVAKIMIALEMVFIKESPNLVLVYGDVNSTMGASLVCAKMGIKICHIEAGLRSHDLTMPEEINRIVVDTLASYHFTPSSDAGKNLVREGISRKNIYFVGNVMIDTLVAFKSLIKTQKKAILPFTKYGLVTIHRPSNVDNPKKLRDIIMSLDKLSKRIPLVFPIHPRTRKQLKKTLPDFVFDSKKIFLLDPLGYLSFLNLLTSSRFVITDSGGIQEEATYLNLPCLTLRSNTERPITISRGTNTLIGDNFVLLEKKVIEILRGAYKKRKKIRKWDGKAAERIAKIISRLKI